MIKRLPVIPTVLVAAAAAVMVWLGVWQLGRSEEKAAMIADFSAIDPSAQPAAITSASDLESLVFRPVTLDCGSTSAPRSTAGTNARGTKGWAHVVRCTETGVEVAMGWSRDPAAPAWSGGAVAGIMAQDGKVVADPALAGLDPLARPDPNDLPNNHLAYAGQWFFFALTALIIYWLAIRSRLAQREV